MHEIQLSDGGPLYTETDFSRWLVEPWNTITAILFLAIVVYWALKIRKTYRQHPFLALALPVSALGGVGGMICCFELTIS